MYKALVRSHLDYCDIIYHIPSIVHHPPLGTSLNYLMEKVEKIRYRAVLAVTSAWQGLNRLKLYEDLRWESLSERCMCKRVLQIHKILHGRTPSYLHDKIPPNQISLIRSKSRSTFDLHNSIYLRNLFQLRVGLSYLRYHKKHQNFAGTLSDICLCKRGVEDTCHFILFYFISSFLYYS